MHANGRFIDERIAWRIGRGTCVRDAAMLSATKMLTPREMQPARMVADGLPSKHVAGRFAITEGTAKLRLHHVYSKLNVRGRVGLIRYLRYNNLD